jgi:prephenate dehydrogenase
MKIAIYGLGLMGASLALALKKNGVPSEVTGIVRSASSKKEGMSLGIADNILLEEEFLDKDIWNNFELIIFSLPVNLTCDKIRLVPSSYQGFLTDMGSTKMEIIKTVEEKYPSTHHYYSSHPMAGSEHSGLIHAKADLYEKRLCILTPPKFVSDVSTEYITKLWHSINMHTIVIDASSHDNILSYLSHTPHILSSLLVNWAAENSVIQKHTEASSVPLTGGGFRDMSRIAGSNPDMWDAIIQTNKEYILNSLLDYRGKLDQLVTKLQENSDPSFWKDYFIYSKKSRDYILKVDN